MSGRTVVCGWKGSTPIKAKNKIDTVKLPVMKISIEFNSFDLYRLIHEHRRMKKADAQVSVCVCACICEANQAYMRR